MTIKDIELADLMEFEWKDFDFTKPDLFITKFAHRMQDYGKIYGEFESLNDPNAGITNPSHIILSVKYDNYKLYGDIKVLDTDHGKLLVNHIKDTNYKWDVKMKTKWNSNEKFTIIDLYTFNFNKKKKIEE